MKDTREASDLQLVAEHPTKTGAVAVKLNQLPPFGFLVRDGDHELRDYQTLVVVKVTVNGEPKAAANKGFRLLAGSIFGASSTNLTPFVG